MSSFVKGRLVFSVQPETAAASYSSARQKSGRSDQPSGSGDFGALVDSNATTAETSRPVDNQYGAESARPARQDNSDQNATAANGKKQTKTSDKDSAEKTDNAKAAQGGKAGGKIKAARDGKDVADLIVTDQTTASAIFPPAPVGVAVIAATAPAPSASASETAASAAPAIAAAAAVKNAASVAAETGIAPDATAKTAQPAADSLPTPPVAQPSAVAAAQAAAQAASDKAVVEITVAAPNPDEANAAVSANDKAAANPSAPQPQPVVSAAATDMPLPTGVEAAAPVAVDTQISALPNGKTTAASTVKNSSLNKADAKDETPQQVRAGKNKDTNKTAGPTHPAGKPETDDTGTKTVKDGNGTDGSDTKAVSPDKPVPAATHEPRIAAQPLTNDPSLQPANAQQQPTQLQPSDTPATPAAQLNATLAAANTPVPLNSLAVDIALKAAGGNCRFEIRLDPAELGRIDVRLDVDKHGQVTSHLTVERPATLDMLRKDAPQLQQALEDAGLKTGDGGLQFSLRDQSSFSGQQNDGQSGRNSQRIIVTEDTQVPAQIAGQTYGRALGSRSGVDISI